MRLDPLSRSAAEQAALVREGRLSAREHVPSPLQRDRAAGDPLPLHRTHDGVPVGVQLAGPVGSEARLLSLAGQLEAAAPWPLTADARAG